ncbi:MAG: hypothetical protein N2043_01840 [Ignavibacterium sp.]|nr:hypothetical protein [Ignavibacterium sp.]
MGKVKSYHTDRRVAISPTPNGELCPFLDYRMVTIGYLFEKENNQQTDTEQTDTEQNCADIKKYVVIQEELNNIIQPNQLELEFFQSTYGFQIKELVENSPLDQPNQLNLDEIEVNEDIKNIHKEHAPFCLISFQTKQQKENLLGTEFQPLQPIQVDYYQNKYLLCSACDFERESEEYILCDYRDWISFGQDSSSLFPICRRYEYYFHSDLFIDTHEKYFTVSEKGIIEWRYQNILPQSKMIERLFDEEE